jgi:hypothetical protein
VLTTNRTTVPKELKISLSTYEVMVRQFLSKMTYLIIYALAVLVVKQPGSIFACEYSKKPTQYLKKQDNLIYTPYFIAVFKIQFINHMNSSFGESYLGVDTNEHISLVGINSIFQIDWRWECTGGKISEPRKVSIIINDQELYLGSIASLVPGSPISLSSNPGDTPLWCYYQMNIFTLINGYEYGLQLSDDSLIIEMRNSSSLDQELKRVGIPFFIDFG